MKIFQQKKLQKICQNQGLYNLQKFIQNTKDLKKQKKFEIQKKMKKSTKVEAEVITSAFQQNERHYYNKQIEKANKRF